MSQQQKKQRGGVTLSAVLAVRMVGAKAASTQFRYDWHLLYLLRRYYGKKRFDFYYGQFMRRRWGSTARYRAMDLTVKKLIEEDHG